MVSPIKDSQAQSKTSEPTFSQPGTAADNPNDRVTAVSSKQLKSDKTLTEEEKKKGLLCLKQIFKIVNLNNPEQGFGTLPLDRVSLVARIMILVKPAMDRPNAESLQTFEEYFFGNVDNCHTFWTMLKAPSPSLATLWKGYNDATEVLLKDEELMMMPYGSTEGTIDARRASFNVVKRFWHYTTTLYAPFFKKYLQEIDEDIKRYEEMRKQMVMEKSASKSSHMKMITYEPIELFHEKLLTKLQQIKNSLRAINQNSRRIHIMNPDEVTPKGIIKIGSTIAHHMRSIQNLSDELGKELASHEGVIAMDIGEEPESPFALQILKKHYTEVLNQQIILCGNIGIHLADLRDSTDSAKLSFLNKKIPPNHLNKWVTFLVERFTLAISSKKPTLPLNQGVFIENFIKFCDALIQNFKTKILNENLLLFKSEKDSEDNLNNRLKKIRAVLEEHSKNMNSKSTHIEKDAVEYLIKFLGKIVSQCSERLNVDKYFLEWLFKKANSTEKSFTAKGVKFSKTGNRAEIEKCATVLKKTFNIRGAAIIINPLYEMLEDLQNEYSRIEARESAVKADEFIEKLLKEEEELNAKRAASEQAEKEESILPSPSITASAAKSVKLKRSKKVVVASTVVTNARVIPSTKPYFKNSIAQTMFEIRNELSQLYGIDPAEMLSPEALASAKSSAAQLARYHTLYAYDAFTIGLEMISICPDERKKVFLFEQNMKWVYRILEQGLTAEYPENYLQEDLSHNLADLSYGLPGSPQNFCTRHLTSQTLWYRFPENYSANGSHALPIGLQIAKNPHEVSFKVISDSMIEDLIALHISALTKRHNTSPHYTRIKSLSEALKKKQIEKEAIDKEAEALPKLTAIETLEKELKGISDKMEKRLKGKPVLSEASAKALGNAQKHLTRFTELIGLLNHYRHQRYVLNVFDSILSPAKECMENLCNFFAWEKKAQFPVHHSFANCFDNTEIGKKLAAADLTTLKGFDIMRADEYLFRHFSNHSKNLGTVKLLHDLYRRQREAVLMGEGATPAGLDDKSVSALFEDILSNAQRYCKLLAAMVSHL